MIAEGAAARTARREASSVIASLDAIAVDHVSAHVKMLHRAAAPLAGQGKLVVASFGEDPTTGEAIRPKVLQFDIGDEDGMTREIARLAVEPHRNVYAPLVVMRPDLLPGKKGQERDIIGVLGFVADFDDADAARYAERLPMPPVYVLETSRGRFQCFYMFSHPIAPREAKPLAGLLRECCGCDSGTADISHVWRVPGVLNWPNKKKVGEGRPMAPQVVTVVKGWSGTACDAVELKARLADSKSTAKPDPHLALVERLDPVRQRMATSYPEGERSEVAFGVIASLIEGGLDDAEIAAEIRKYPTGVGARYLDKESALVADIGRIRQKLLRRGDGDDLADPDRAEPYDIFGDVRIAGEPELPDCALPDVIERFADDEAGRLGVTRAMVALPAIVACAASLDDGWRVQPKRHDTRWTEAARLWLAIVGEPGIKKSPAISSALAPIEQMEAEWIADDEAKLKQHRIEEKVFAKQLERYATDKAKGNDAEPPVEPVRPRKRRRIASDATTEALSDILIDNPAGILIKRDELVALVGSFDAYRDGKGGKDRADYLELYNGGKRAIDRINRGTLLVPNWSASIVGGIQPGPLRRVLAKIDDDGLIQRFMVVYGRRAGDGEDRPPDHQAIAAYHATTRKLLEAEPDGMVRRLSEEAQDARAQVQRVADAVASLPDTSAAFRAHLDKWDGLFARLLLTYHMVEALSRGQMPGEIIGGETAERVARLMLDFLLPHAARFYSELFQKREEAAHARWIAGYLLAHGLRTVTLREIGRAYRNLRGDHQAIREAMGALEIAGWVKPVDINGKPPSRWEVFPLVHRKFAARGDAERIRRDAEKAKIAAAERMLSSVEEPEAA
jgi:hypothetical protein